VAACYLLAEALAPSPSPLSRHAARGSGPAAHPLELGSASCGDAGYRAAQSLTAQGWARAALALTAAHPAVIGDAVPRATLALATALAAGGRTEEAAARLDADGVDEVFASSPDPDLRAMAHACRARLAIEVLCAPGPPRERLSALSRPDAARVLRSIEAARKTWSIAGSKPDEARALRARAAVLRWGPAAGSTAVGAAADAADAAADTLDGEASAALGGATASALLAGLGGLARR